MDVNVLRYWSRIVNMISVRNQWLIDRAPAREEARSGLSAYICLFQGKVCRQRQNTASTQDNYYNPIFNHGQIQVVWLGTGPKICCGSEIEGGRVWGLHYCPATLFMLSQRFIIQWAMSCELPLLVSVIAIFWPPGSFHTALSSSITRGDSPCSPNSTIS